MSILNMLIKKEETPTGLGRYGAYYVYFLMYPNEPDVFGKRAGTVFYVGKGTGRRVSAHETETRAILLRNRLMKLGHKNKVIIEIWDAGYQVVQKIIGRTDDEELAYRVESEYIDYFTLSRLTNSTYGRRPVGKRKRTPRA